MTKKKKKKKACGNSCFSSLFAAEDVSRGITSATRRQKFDQGNVKLMWNSLRSRRKKGRGKGKREKRERGEKGREPLPSFPNPPLFSLPPYPPTSSDACFAGYMYNPRLPDILCEDWFSVLEAQTFVRAKRPQRRRACEKIIASLWWENSSGDLRTDLCTGGTVWSIRVVELIECED